MPVQEHNLNGDLEHEGDVGGAPPHNFACSPACQVVPSDMEKMLDAHGNSTIYLSTIDKDGNIVSLIQSNFAGYGTGMVAPGLGFSFHNRGAGF